MRLCNRRSSIPYVTTTNASGQDREGQCKEWLAVCQYTTNNNRIQRCSSRFFTVSLLRREPSPTRTIRCSSLRHEPSPTRKLKWSERNRVQITCNTSSAYHVQLVVLSAAWYEGTAQLLSLAEFKFEFYLIGWIINHEGGEETGVPREDPLLRASELWLGETARLIYSFYLSVAARKLVIGSVSQIHCVCW